MQNLTYPFGFLFTSSGYKNVPAYYSKICMLKKYDFFYDANRDFDFVEQENQFIIIHGRYTHVGIKNSMNSKELSEYLLKSYFEDRENFLNTIDFIGGRYIIIIGDLYKVEMFTDATSSRSVYFSTKEDIVSSHAHMIADNIHLEKSSHSLISRAMNYTYDFSPYKYVKAIVPNFSLSYYDKKLERYFPRAGNKYKKLNEEEIFEMVEKLWRTSADKYLSKYENIIFSLTGGNDSRTNLAMLRKYKDKIKFFTYAATDKTDKITSLYDKTNEIDRYIVNQIVHDLNLNHTFIFYRHKNYSLPKELSDAIDKNAVNNHGKYLISHYLNDIYTENSIHIRANLLEIGRAYLVKSNSNDYSFNEITDLFIGYASNKSFNGDEDDLEIIREVVQDKNIELYGGKNFYDYNIIDLSFWETRMGRWNSEIYNETDVLFDSCTPYNMRAIIDISLSFTLKERKRNYFFQELINRNFPVLNFYGVNKFVNLYENTKLREPEIFKDFQVFNNEAIIDNFSTENNLLYIPFNYLKKGYHVEKIFEFSHEKGYIHLNYLSSYYNEKARGYINFEILINDIVIVREDISSWNVENELYLFNLVKNDKVSIRLTAQKNITGKSWENASKIIFNNFIMIKSNKTSPVVATSTNPYMEIINTENTGL